MSENGEIEVIKNKTIVKIDGEKGGERLRFFCADGSEYLMLHHQDCCEIVYLEDIVGDFSDIIGEPVLIAEETTNRDLPPAEGGDYSYTWTFYTIRTNRGTVTLRWYGSSNGYYGEDVSFVEIEPPKEQVIDS